MTGELDLWWRQGRRSWLDRRRDEGDAGGLVRRRERKRRRGDGERVGTVVLSLNSGGEHGLYKDRWQIWNRSTAKARVLDSRRRGDGAWARETTMKIDSGVDDL